MRGAYTQHYAPLCLSLATETRDEDLVVLVDEVQATVHGHEGGDLLAVLDELDTDGLTNGRVGLLGLDTDLLENDTLGLGRATSRRRAVEVLEGALAVEGVGPPVLAPVVAQLAGGVHSTRLSHDDYERREEGKDVCEHRGRRIEIR